MPFETFEVDTHLFRELGELLVGRNSTALVELIKNAYDADATRVVIDGQNLDNPDRGRITISDDGVGMSADDFQRGFLTIAGRLKDSHSRKSAKFRRRYTGAKGIGRLAAHKLAKHITIDSCPDPEHVAKSDEILHATIDWDLIESRNLLREIKESEAIDVRTDSRPRKANSGTTITLERLRKKWTDRERVQFQSEVESFRPPEALIRLPKGLVEGDRLFAEPRVADVGSDASGFNCELSGAFATGEEFWPQLAQSGHWLIEIDASSRHGSVKIRVSPTKNGKSEFPSAQTADFKDTHPDHEIGPHFHARILIREGGGGNRTFKQWVSRSYGVRVYNEGFRVLPYGEPQNDWLSLDADYNSRAKTLSYLESTWDSESPQDDNEGLMILGNTHYFGAVFLTSAGAPNLRMLINREGFIADRAFDNLVSIVRTAIYLSVRVRAATKRQTREDRRVSRNRRTESRLDLKQAVELSVNRATDFAREAKQLAAQGDIRGAKAKIDEAASHFTQGSEIRDRLMSEGAILRILASVGTQMTAFVHEINSILGMVKALETAVLDIERESTLTAHQRKRLFHLRSAIEDLRRGIERQASYLTDVISPDARRRRSRQKLADRFEAGQRLVAAAAAKRGIDIENRIPLDLKSPPMFPAELTVIFSNVLTNAVKAAGANGLIRATGNQESAGQVTIRIENTGVAVDVVDSERWFRPFESTTVETDPVLGQGMGMGLPITRNILEEYGGTIHFCPPSRRFATAVEIRFSK